MCSRDKEKDRWRDREGKNGETGRGKEREKIGRERTVWLSERERERERDREEQRDSCGLYREIYIVCERKEREEDRVAGRETEGQRHGERAGERDDSWLGGREMQCVSERERERGGKAREKE